MPKPARVTAQNKYCLSGEIETSQFQGTEITRPLTNDTSEDDI
jgi:hypothetical protein